MNSTYVLAERLEAIDVGQPSVGSLKGDLFKEKDFSDATLICQGKEIQINKFMLGARSDVFKTMLSKQDFVEGD